jgi:DNA repair exonuclease SbcCD ATPase subunit
MTTEAMMQMLLDGQPPASMQDQLAALAQSNPKLAPILSKLQERMQRQAEMAKAAEAEEDSTPLPGMAEPEVLSANADENAVDNLKRLARRMFSELSTLRARNEKLAEALGACSLCWGEDHACPQCGGQGLPGAFAIDRKTFLSVAGSAMRQVRQQPTM